MVVIRLGPGDYLEPGSSGPEMKLKKKREREREREKEKTDAF